MIQNMIEITPVLKENISTPIYIQLYEYIKCNIEKENIPANSRLPSIRKLSTHLTISRNTVEAAYEQLLAEGYIESKPRSGLFVKDIKKDLLIPMKDAAPADKYTLSRTKTPSYKIDFSYGAIDTDIFPINTWRKLTNQSLQNKAALLYGHRQGEANLRQEIAKYLYQSRGVVCSPEEILVGAGIQQLLSQLCLLFDRSKKPGIAVENPGYESARTIFKQHHFQILPIPLNEDGICIDTLTKSKTRLAFVTPSHQFPMGMIMPIGNRLKLIQWAKEEDAFIIEDDYDSEFRYSGKPIPALKGLDVTGRVIYLGTFSKALTPSIRLSYMVLPPKLLEKYYNNVLVYEQPTSKIHQMTLYNFMKEGFWNTHLRKIRTSYHKKYETLLKAIKTHMKNHVKVIGTGGGLHVLIEIQLDISEEKIIQQAEDIQIKVYPTSKYWFGENGNKYPTIQLGFGGLTLNEINEGIYLLSKKWFSSYN